MRKAFSQEVIEFAKKSKKVVFLTGDLGFMALEKVRDCLGNRFINAGVSEQNIISMAAALASEGFTPICYSISPFIVFRPAEQIRLDVCLHNMNVKIVGNGGGYGYGIMGGTHHAIEDLGVLTTFQNMRCYIPFCKEDVPFAFSQMMNYNGPSYLRLGSGEKPSDLKLTNFSPIRMLTQGEKLTVIALGPIALNVILAIREIPDAKKIELFVVSEMPISKLPESVIKSLKKTKNLLVIEEHVSRGGLGEELAELILTNNLNCHYKHLYAAGYPNGLYGSQQYHQKVNSLDCRSIITIIKQLVV